MGVAGYQSLVAEAARRNIPLEVSLELTHHCNFRCAHCYIPDFAAPDLLPTERLMGLLDELAKMGTLYLSFTGGELLLRRDWVVLGRYARTLGFFLTLMTNASLIDEAAADLIADLPARVEVSMYSMDEEVFERITGLRGSYRRTRWGIELLCRRHVEVVLKTPVMTHNYSGIDAVATWAEEVGADFMAFASIVARKDGDLAPLRLRVPDEELLAFFSGPYFGCNEPGDENGADPDGGLCAAGRRYCNITPTGDVLACNILPGSAGNLRERTFREIWDHSPSLAKIRSIQHQDLTTCRTCPALSYCGRCPAQALVEDGDILGPSAAACRRAAVIRKIRATRAAAGSAVGRDG